MMYATNRRLPALAAALVLAIGIAAPMSRTARADLAVAQAVAPVSANDDDSMSADERMSKRFPQPVRVGDLIGLPVLNDGQSTIGYVRKVVRTRRNKIQLIVSYSRWWGWLGRPVAVPIEVVGIFGRQLASLDMDEDEYADAPTWTQNNATTLPDDATIRIALAKH